MISGSSWWLRPPASGFAGKDQQDHRKYDLLFLDRFRNNVDMEDALDPGHLDGDTPLRQARRWASPTRGSPPSPAGSRRDQRPCGESRQSSPALQGMDETCAAEFEGQTPITTPPTTSENQRYCQIMADNYGARKVLGAGLRPIRIRIGIESLDVLFGPLSSGPSSVRAMRPSSSTTTETVSTDFDGG